MTPEERKRRNVAASLRYQRRMMAEDSPAGERFRARRREMDRKRRERKRAGETDRIATLAARIAASNATRRAQAVIKAEAAKRSAQKAVKANALASLPEPKVERQTVEQWVAAGGQIEVLPSQLGQAFRGLGRGVAVSLY